MSKVDQAATADTHRRGVAMGVAVLIALVCTLIGVRAQAIVARHGGEWRPDEAGLAASTPSTGTAGQPSATMTANSPGAPAPTPAGTVSGTPDEKGYLHSNLPASGAWRTNTISVRPQASEPQVHSYVVKVETSLPLDANEVAHQIAGTLNDPRGWTGWHGTSFNLVSNESDAEFAIYLSSAPTTDRLCLPMDTGGVFDCRNGRTVALNVDRWLFATPSYAGHPLGDYRSYLVNHEVGHYIGLNHVPCPGAGQPAPVMLQQSIELDGCLANVWPQTSHYE